MRRKILKYSLITLSIIFSFLSWQKVEKEINSPDSSGWILPIIFFTLFFISFYLATVTIKERDTLNALTFFCLSLSFIFVLNPWHFISILLGLSLALSGIYRIRRDMGLNTKISLVKTLTTGKQFIILAFAIVLASQYFFSIKDKEFEELVPKFSNNRYSSMLTSKILSIINPEYKKISNEEITVDEFIVKSQKKQLEESGIMPLSNDQIENSLSQIGNNIPDDQKEKIKNELRNNLSSANNRILEENNRIILEESRKKLENLIGKGLTGEEKMSEVFEGIINRKITDYLRPDISEKTNPSLLQVILVIILFLTIVSLGSILNIFWMLFSTLVFWILVKFKVISINKVPALVEMIE